MPWIGSYLRPKNALKVCSPFAANGKPKNVGLGIPDTPLGPLVTSVQLRRMMRTISPKASVTMAR